MSQRQTEVEMLCRDVSWSSSSSAAAAAAALLRVERGACNQEDACIVRGEIKARASRPRLFKAYC